MCTSPCKVASASVTLSALTSAISGPGACRTCSSGASSTRLPGRVRGGSGGTLRVMADRTSSTITVAAARLTVMGVIADFGAYPEWASGIRSAEVLASRADGRAGRVRFGVDAGVIKDSYVLSYNWDGDAAVRWQLAEAGSVVTEMSGEYQLAEDAQS